MAGLIDFHATVGSNVSFEGKSFSTGATKVTCILTTDNLSIKGGGPKPGACKIVNRLNTNWDVRSLIDIKNVQAALKDKTTLKKLSEASSVDKILSLLGLEEIAMLADYSELQAQKYVKGHLLAQGLGGPGDDRNLTPMSSRCNFRYSTVFEGKMIAAIREAKQIEEKSNFRVKFQFTAECSGHKTSWWRATKETKAMLNGLPATLIASCVPIGFFKENPKNEKIAYSKLPDIAKKQFRKFQKGIGPCKIAL
ncbi:DNA/RNA non-specific endonuclease [Leisingera caerulea]|uniref:DNA/RNA non-specific endonuclease n=1 Tax=Leisingera caerulea TaxID=506591 RepID=A0A9Q9HHH8_LEICA|nr:DNA/RNA non-specific endonuclease [Leisingera caerulea]UWQ52405.1 DNA/RNA non-specific endonuclease [Leisingera caerulea]